MAMYPITITSSGWLTVRVCLCLFVCVCVRACAIARVWLAVCLTQVSFESDVVLSQMNEYEVLQLLMGDCRERLSAYRNSLEEDIKAMQQEGVAPRERLALRLTRAEKKIVSRTMDAMRQRLAPIRGAPVPLPPPILVPHVSHPSVLRTLPPPPPSPSLACSFCPPALRHLARVCCASRCLARDAL